MRGDAPMIRRSRARSSCRRLRLGEADVGASVAELSTPLRRGVGFLCTFRKCRLFTFTFTFTWGRSLLS